MSSGRHAILFDVDGTLLDTDYLHVLAWSRAFAGAGHAVSMSALHALIGMGSDKLLERLAEGTGGAVHGELDAAHSRHYSELAGDVRPFPRAAELLRRCHDGGAVVVLATSAKGEEVDRILEKIDAGDAIDEVISSADVAASKPDPAIFLEGLRRAGAGARDAVAVGDTVWDVQGARRAGLGCVTVTTGGIARQVLAQAGALAVYDDVADLCDRLETSPLAGLI